MGGDRKEKEGKGDKEGEICKNKQQQNKNTTNKKHNKIK
jgi:hypothetical protein